MDLICKCGKGAEVQTFNLSRIKYCMYCGYYEIHDIECDHEYKQILFKLSNGNKQLREYCPKCHQRSPQPLKQNKFKKYPIKNEDSYKSFMDILNEKDKMMMQPLIDQLQNIRQYNFKAGYYEYIKSDQWYELREQILKRDNYICQICGGKAEEVHHLTYKNFKNEYQFELVSLCKRCHKEVYHS